MRMDWLPISAAFLLTGILALCLGSFLLPSGDDTTDTLRVVQEQGGQWLAIAAIFFLSSVFLTLGLPSVLTLFQARGRTLGMVAGVVLEFGFLGTAGVAMLMVFIRSLVVTDALVANGLEDAVSETGMAVFLYIWVAGFYLGELLLGIALLRAGTVPRWVPLSLLLHVLTLPVSGLLPEAVSKATVLLMVLGFAGIAIQATSPQHRRRFT